MEEGERGHIIGRVENILGRVENKSHGSKTERKRKEGGMGHHR